MIWATILSLQELVHKEVIDHAEEGEAITDMYQHYVLAMFAQPDLKDVTIRCVASPHETNGQEQ